jgi:polyprenyldihydroxybenzoate methyltransferase/3-demethylubiquinol 3-O-methyltransferase
MRRTNLQLARHGSTIDKREVDHFDTHFDYYLWWKSSQGKALRAMNGLRIPLIRDSLAKTNTNKPLRGKTILDVGSGGGIVSEPLARLGANVTGIDPVPSNVDIANQHMNDCSPNLKSNLKYISSTIEGFASQELNTSAFDAVVASEVLEHVTDVSLFISSVSRLVKPGGKFIVTTINQTAAAHLFAIILAESLLLNLVPKGTHSYDKLVPLEGLRFLLNENGFTVKETRGMFYNPFTKKWAWSSCTLVNYAIVAEKSKQSSSASVK